MKTGTSTPLSFIAHARRVLAAASALSLAALLQAQTTATGTIEGRVFDAGRGEYLDQARVIVEGTNQETFTDSSGQYRFSNVPVGDVKVRVFFTGLLPQTNAVTVAPGQTTQHNITLTATAKTPAQKAAAVGDTVKLDQFVVSTSKEMDGAAN